MAAELATATVKIMVASTVYGFEDQLRAICSVLEGYGYTVLNSHWGTLRTNSHANNLDLCLDGVRECDVVLGIIRPFYGSGVIGDTSITHEELRLALTLDKPRWVLVDERVEFMAQILKRNKFVEPFSKTAVFDDSRVVELYEEMRQSTVPVGERIGYWVQPYRGLDDVLRYLATNFEDIEAVRRLIK